MLVARVGWRLRSGSGGAQAAVGRDVEQDGVHLVSGKAVEDLDPRPEEHPAALGNQRAAAPWVERGRPAHPPEGAATCSRFRARGPVVPLGFHPGRGGAVRVCHRCAVCSGLRTSVPPTSNGRSPL